MKTATHKAYRLIISLALMTTLVMIGVVKPQEPVVDNDLFRGLRPAHPRPLIWDSLAEGFDRTVLKFEGEAMSEDKRPKLIPRHVELLVYRIDAERYPVRVVSAQTLFGQKKVSLAAAHSRVGAILTVNGGFFSKEGDPVGLVISDGKQHGLLSKEGGSGALAVYGGIIRIGWATNVAMSEPQPDQAIQNGPLLVEPEHVFGIVHIREKFFSRTVAALDDKGRLLIGVTKKLYREKDIYSGLNLYETARIFFHPEELGGLGASVAINLDGGTSTGMELTMGTFHEQVRVGIALPNFVCVMPAKQ